MSRRVVTLNEFDRQSKRLVKKFRFLGQELAQLGESLVTDPTQDKPLGAGLYKIRLSSASKGGGKSGGFRVVTYYVAETADAETVYLVTIYDKSEDDSIGKDDLLTLLRRDLPG